MLKKFFTLIFTLIIFTSTVSAMPDSRTTLICALSSMASYSGEINLLMLSMLHDDGWEINPIEEKFEKTRVRSFLISKPDENLKIISICGTESDKDLLTDIRFGKISYNDQAKDQSMVHRGFLNYTDELLNLIREEILNFSGKIIVTGHSLGGAVAILTSARLIDLGISPDQIEVVTFGAPAVGDKIFADEFSDRMNLTRFENDGDVIPKSLASMGYTSFGEKIELNPRELGDKNPHAMSLYLDCAIRNFIDESEPIESTEKIQIEGIKDPRYVDWILRDGLRTDSKYRIEEKIEVTKIRESNGKIDRVELTELIYDLNGNLLTMQSASSTTKDLTIIECARFLQEKLQRDRESLLN